MSTLLAGYRRAWPRRFDFCDLLSVLLVATLLGVALWTFRDYSISNDEGVQHRYGEMILAYYASGFTDKALFDFSNLYLSLSDKVTQAQVAYAAANNGTHLSLLDAQKAGPVLAWGDFVTVTLNFVIVAFCIFLMVKGVNKLSRHEEAAAPPTPTEQLLTEIRDLLNSRP